MNLFKKWRESNWQEVDKATYQQAYDRFGGSVVTHPLVVESASRVSEMPLRYLGRFHEQDLIGALPVWDQYIACSKMALIKAGKRDSVDTGNAEVILPLSRKNHFDLRFKTVFLSAMHQHNLTNIKKHKTETISLLKSYEAGADQHCFSKKFKYNQRRELRIFEEAGGYYQPVETFSCDAFSDMYIDLFRRRWKGKNPKGSDQLPRFLRNIKPLQKGFVLFSHEKRPVAIQFVLQAESPEWISVEYINGGLDPDFKSMSIGSILTYLNTRAAHDYARDRNKSLRYSFGKSDGDYKKRWCYQSPLFRTGGLF